MLESYEAEAEELNKQIVDICYFMKGGITYNEAWGLSFLQRTTVVKNINKRNRETSGGPEYLGDD